MSDYNPVCREGQNLIALQRVPVVFVPGVMGTRLHMTVDWLPDWYWDPECEISIMAQWLALSASQKGSLLSMDREAVLEGTTDHCQTDSQRNRGWNTIAWSSYGEFIEYFEGLRFGSTKTPIYAFGYDWRQDIRLLGKRLAADILGQAVSGEGPGDTVQPSKRFGGAVGILDREHAKKCIILTHSMGGLVTRAALKICPALREKVAGVLHVVQPATGAPVLFRRFITGCVGDETDGGGPFSKILGNTGPKFATVVSGCSGPNQLMPSNLYRDACIGAGTNWYRYTRFREYWATEHKPGGPVHDQFRRSSADFPPGAMRKDIDDDVRDSLRDRMNEVESFHNFLGDWKLEKKTWSVYGDGVLTDSTVKLNLPPEGPKPDDLRVRTLMYDPPIFEYYGVRPDGTELILDATNDIERRGWDKESSRSANAPRDPTRPSRSGDGTVPALSGSALFPGHAVDLSTSCAPQDFTKNFQFRVRGLKHEPAFRDAAVKDLVHQFVTFILNPAPCAAPPPAPATQSADITIQIDRRPSTAKSTPGKLTVKSPHLPGTVEGGTIEQPAGTRDLGKGSGRKTYPIPAGTYQAVIRLNKNTRFNYDCIEILNVPGFSDILIHQGNEAHQTEGCILIGTPSGPDFVANSGDKRKEIDSFREEVQETIGTEPTIEVIIRDP